MDYFPKLNLAFCSCAKCGSTSAYGRLFKQIFHTGYPQGPPWVQDRGKGTPWKGERKAFKSWRDFKKVLQQRPQQVDVVALVRDPYDRLVSAWKSKIRCCVGLGVRDCGVDWSDRNWMVPALLKLARVPKHKWTDCLSITDFAMAVQQVYLQGDACKLDIHFRPQSLGCFAEMSPSNYTLVTTAKGIGASQLVAFSNMSHSHSSPSRPLVVHPTTQAILKQLAGAEAWTQHTQL